MFPVKMNYSTNSFSSAVEVDVYSFEFDNIELVCYAICWVPTNKEWLIAPIHTLTPINKKKELLNESV